jgi:hypothetical protein
LAARDAVLSWKRRPRRTGSHRFEFDAGIPRGWAEGFARLTKMEPVYQYLTGPQFRHSIDAIIEKFPDLDPERKTMMRMWAKRVEQLKGVLDSTAGLYGGSPGHRRPAMQEIESLGALVIEVNSAPSE